MADENTGTQTSSRPPPAPNPDLKSLDKLVGTWQISGEAQGQIRYEWMEGGFFLVQHVDLEHSGRTIKGIEMIGHLHGFGEAPGSDIRSRFYSFLDGLTLDYVYEAEGDTFTIRGGEKGSPAFYRGTFSADGSSFSGAWQWPGGGYTANGTRVK